MEDPFLGLLLVAPALVWFLFVRAYPLFDGLRLSLVNMRLLGGPVRFVGLQNFGAVLRLSEFHLALLRSIWWAFVNTLLQVVGSIIVAMILNQRYVGRTVVRNFIIVPWVLPTVVLAIIWRWMLDPTLGVVNHMLLRSGIVGRPISFLGSLGWVMWTVIGINAWRWTPYFSIIVLASLQGVSREMLEAAQVDGASAWRRFWSMILPSIGPVVGTVAMISFLTAFNIFDTIWLLTFGGPITASTTLPLFIFRRAFLELKWGQGAAASVLMFVVLAVATAVYLRTTRRVVEGP